MKNKYFIFLLPFIFFVSIVNAKEFNKAEFIANQKISIYNKESNCLKNAITKENKNLCITTRKKEIRNLYKEVFDKEKNNLAIKTDQRINILKKQYKYIIQKLQDRENCILISKSWKDIKQCYKDTVIKLKK